MDRLARIFAIVLLVVFAAGTIAHAANATSMSVAMSSAAMAAADMGDCCPPADDGKASFCMQFCLAPLVAFPAAAGFELPILLGADSATTPAEDIAGQTGPPDLPPPRTIVL
jgi:phosphatidylglycerophosphate synthase